MTIAQTVTDRARRRRLTDSAAHTGRHVSRFEVVAGVVVLAIPFQLLGFSVWGALHLPAPCTGGEALTYEVREDGFITEDVFALHDDTWEATPGCTEDWRRPGHRPEQGLWINPQGNVGLKCEEAFGLREVRVIRGEEVKAGMAPVGKDEKHPPHGGCQVVGFDVPDHWEVVPG